MDEIWDRASTSQELEAAGIVKIRDNSLKLKGEYERWLANAKHVDLFMAYADSWRGTYRTELEALAKSSGVKMRIVLADPNDDDTVNAIAKRHSTPEKLETADEIRRRIRNSVASFQEYQRDAGKSGNYRNLSCTPRP